MINNKEYVAMRERSRKHLVETLGAFEFWGEKVGRIQGDIKDKWSEARWYADLGPSSLFELINVDANYRWQPDKSRLNKFMHMLNLASTNFFIFAYFTILYKLFFYNLAYTIAMVKNPDCAKDIFFSADYTRKIILGKPIIWVTTTYYKFKKILISKLGRK
jgi:hypothetical protein